METPITIEQISHIINENSATQYERISVLIDSKLEPIKNDISAIKTDVNAIQIHVKSINERLYKIEDRMAKMEVNLDKLAKRTTELETA